MSDFYVADTVQTSTADTITYFLDGTGDTLFLAASGAFINTGPDIGCTALESVADNEHMTIDGTVYSANATAIYVTGNSSTVLLNGEAIGNGDYAGVSLGGAGSQSGESLQIGAQGEASGSNGVSLYCTSASVSNDGLITGSSVGLLAQSSSDTVVNSGTISGVTTGVDIAIGTGEIIDNSGTISGGQYSFLIYDNPTSTISATIDNSGTIHGEMYLQDPVVVTNSGLIEGEINGLGNTLTLDNEGKIVGPIVLNTNTGDTLTNDGTIHGSITMGSGDTLTNTGRISGDVTFAGGANTLDTTHGEITGTVTGGGGVDKFDAAGSASAVTFYGEAGADVLTGGAGDDVINGGAGNDTITGGKGDDTLTGGTGADKFDFSGSFGHDTITDFAATGTSHDTIHFAHDDFANFAALQPDMVQVGSDVVITHDASDTIVLQHVTLASLTSADFLFG